MNRFGTLLIVAVLTLTACGGSNPTATPIAPTPATFSTATPSPVDGSVMVEGGSSLAGGVINDPLGLSVRFAATSSGGAVTQMRVNAGSAGGCLREIAMQSLQWEPFAAEKTYTTTLSSGIQGWYLSVQYMDGAGAVSPVYCDDISIEGMPPYSCPITAETNEEKWKLA